MEFRKMTAEEAAALIQNGQTIGLSGFTRRSTQVHTRRDCKES